MNTALKPVTLYVEGITDQSFIRCILINHFSKYKEGEHFSIQLLNGKDDLLKKFKTIPLPNDNCKVIAFFIDLDVNKDCSTKEDAISRATQSIKTALKNANLPVPLATGSISVTDFYGTRTAFFLIPNNQDYGMIDTLALQAGKQYPSISGCIETFEKCLREKNIDINNIHKFRFQIYTMAIEGRINKINLLADKDIENQCGGEYIPFFNFGTTEEVNNSSHPLNSLVTFLKTLFHETTPHQQESAL